MFLCWKLSAILLALCWTYASAFTKDDCPPNIPRDTYTGVYGNKCYRLEAGTEKEYVDAQRYCVRRGGNLAMVKTQGINQYLVGFLSSVSFDDEAWIGLNDIDDENHFKWVDGTPMRYNNWASYEEGPRVSLLQNEVEDCVAMDMDSSGRWRDYRCEDYWIFTNEHKHFICEYEVEVKVYVKKTTIAPTTYTTTTTITTPRPSVKTTPAAETATTRRTSTVNATLVSVSEVTSAIRDDTTLDSDGSGRALLNATSASHAITTPDNETKTKTPGSGTGCGKLICDLDCDMGGYQQDSDGCLICACDEGR